MKVLMPFMISVVQVLYFIQRKNDLYAMQKSRWLHYFCGRTMMFNIHRGANFFGRPLGRWW
uniref:Uncharacterized protein n=1 Tax=Manihot esculenta TaxID=3983 RepID=A0A2C9U6I3_MANES